jgi:hypothetical protein
MSRLKECSGASPASKRGYIYAFYPETCHSEVLAVSMGYDGKGRGRQYAPDGMNEIWWNEGGSISIVRLVNFANHIKRLEDGG